MSGRWAAGAFAVLCAGGSTAALTLAVHEATATDPVTAHVRSTSRTGLKTTASVEVRNTTSQGRCAAIRVVASDRDGHDLATAWTPLQHLQPRQVRRVTALLTLTAQQYAERLTVIRAVPRGCR